MAKLQSSNVTVGGQNNSIIQALAEGIVRAGGNPDVDLIRIASQEGLAGRIAKFIMEELLVRVGYVDGFQITYSRAGFQILESNSWDFGSSQTTHNLLHSLIYEAGTLGKESRDGKCFDYEVFKIQRDLSPDELFERFGKGDIFTNHPLIMELLLLGELTKNGMAFLTETSQQLLIPHYVAGKYSGKYFPLLDIKQKKFRLHDVNLLGLSAGMTVLCYREQREVL